MIQQFSHLFFIGIGGIGMSALARYFNAKGKQVSGYDRSSTALTKALEEEGITITYADDIAEIPSDYKVLKHCMVIYTPAIPQTSSLLNWFQDQGFVIKKRAEVLGMLTQAQQSICVSGTHGKTTISTMISHLMYASPVGCNAFLGGISQNYESNLLLCEHSDKVVIEADEFDRSFLHLHPHTATVSATDADHLDIYGSHESLKDTFRTFSSQIEAGGLLIYKAGLDFTPDVNTDVKVLTYQIDCGDFHTQNLRLVDGLYHFDLVTPDRVIDGFVLGVPGRVNVENAVVALAVAYIHGVSDGALRSGLKSFKGIKRRFEYHVNSEDGVYIDDYAHHPEELKATISSVRALYPHKTITGVFQPHLYSRTQDFAPEFAQALSLLDNLWLMDIYPARELPIEGVTSQLIAQGVTCPTEVLSPQQVLSKAKTEKTEVLLTLGAGDIDRLVPEIAKIMKQKQ